MITSILHHFVVQTFLYLEHQKCFFLEATIVLKYGVKQSGGLSNKMVFLVSFD